MDNLLKLFESMLRIRMVEEMIAERYSEQEMRCPTHFCLGQEAVPVGVSSHLRHTDYVYSGHRSHGHYLAKGGSLKAMVSELYGKETGCALGRGGSQHLNDLDAGFIASAPILGGTIPIAVGSVYSTKSNVTDKVSVVYFGDGATEEGIFHEALNFASVKKLPVIFVCENNLYSVHSSFDVRQPKDRNIADIGPAHKIPSVRANGNDVEEVMKIAGDAINRARDGGGPSLLEFMTYRWLEHCGPNKDLDLSYRNKEEMDEWLSKCPIKLFETKLYKKNILNKESRFRIEQKILKEINSAFEYAKKSPFPDPQTLFDYTYVKS